MAWMESQVSRSGEVVPPRKQQWRLKNRERLKSAFPESEKRFCKVIDKLRFHLGGSTKELIRYKRQKLFSMDSEICFYVDFFFKAFKLAMEIDGTSHSGEEAKLKDQWRERLIGSNGITFLRFTNDELDSLDWREIESRFLSAIRNVDGRDTMKRQLFGAIAKLSNR